MQILSAEQIRLWDEYTIRNEPIASIDLMERAASACMDWLESRKMLDNSFCIFCGKGNNGGDGLAIARMLSARLSQVVVYILEFGHKGTEDFQINLARLHQTKAEILFIQSEETIPEIAKEVLLIDALYGSGLNRPLEGVTAQLITRINQCGNEIISIDIPSGMYVDKTSKGNPMVMADHVLSFQCFKPAFLVAENQDFIGDLHLLDIGLHPGFIAALATDIDLVNIDFIRALYKPRKPFAHKGNFGHALLIAGSRGRMGAALLAAKACLRSGAGLLTCHLPASGMAIFHTALPEAMVDPDPDDNIVTHMQPEPGKYKSIGIGPGIGTEEKTKKFLNSLLAGQSPPMILDADALNILSVNKKWLEKLPPYSILSPHPKEFERLFGVCTDDFQRIQVAREQSKRLQIIIILKGHFTFMAVPGGSGFYNSTGNPGMAKGGSGDALTGILTGLLAQGYSAIEAAILGVFIHGMAGDLAAKEFSEPAMLASDLIECLGKAFLMIEGRS